MRKKSNNKPMEIYIKSSPERHETVFSGIRFVDFIECASIQVENMLLMKSDYMLEKNYLKFEIAEGKEEIDRLTCLMCEDEFKCGDFSFVDYVDTASLSRLSDEQVAELLYLAHMIKPLKSPFFEALQNNFVYLSHDDGWYCKLYCKEQKAPIEILLNKLQRIVGDALCNIAYLLSDDLVNKVNELSEKGLFIELDVSIQRKKVITIRLYEVGQYEDMDLLFNSLEDIRPQLSFEEQVFHQ